MTAGQLRDLFVVTLLRDQGGARRDWRLVVGEVKVYAPATHRHCNWAVTPTGSIEQIAAVEQAADTLRMAHPIVAG